MRNMKRAISLLIALVTVAAFMVVPAFGLSEEYTAAEAANEGLNAAVTEFSDVQKRFGVAALPDVDYTMESTNDGTSIPNITIDFNAESIYWTLGVAPGDASLPTYASLDGGQKWSALKFSIGTAATGDNAVDFSKNLNKESTIWLTNALDPETKQPQKASGTGEDAIAKAVVWKFAKFNARPKLDKFTVDYLTYGKGDNLGQDGQWTLKATGTQKITALQVGYSKDKKTVVGGYGAFPEGSGIKVVEGDTKPGEKLTFLVRVAATNKSAGSKAKKFNISTLTKAPNLKVDYKKGIIKMKANMLIGMAGVVERDSEDDEFILESVYWGKLNGKDVTAKVTTKESAEVKPGFGIMMQEASALDSDTLGGFTNYGVRIVATEKKPASLVQLITVNPYSEVLETNASLSIKGATVKLPKGYELAKLADATKVDTKWKTSTKEAGVYAVRIKNAAKYNAKTNATSGATVSGNLLLEVKMGTDSKGKALANATYIQKSGTTETASAATSAVYAAASELKKSAKATENKIADAVGAVITIAGDAADVKYKVTGLKGIIDGVEADPDAEAIPDAVNEVITIPIIDANAEIVGDGEITVEFIYDGATTTDAEKLAKETFFAPTITVTVSGYKEPAATEPGDTYTGVKYDGAEVDASVTIAADTTAGAFKGKVKYYIDGADTTVSTYVFPSADVPEKTVGQSLTDGEIANARGDAQTIANGSKLFIANSDKEVLAIVSITVE